MGLFGGSKSSSSIDNSQTTYEQNESSSLQAGQVGIRGDNNAISVIDGGAVKDAFAFGSSAIQADTTRFNSLVDGVSNWIGDVSKGAQDAISRGQEASNIAVHRISEAYQTSTGKSEPVNTNLILVVAAAIALLLSMKK